MRSKRDGAVNGLASGRLNAIASAPAGLLLSLLGACSAAPASNDASREYVAVAVAPAKIGAAWKTKFPSWLVVTVIEMTGKSTELSWDRDSITVEDAADRFTACLDQAGLAPGTAIRRLRDWNRPGLVRSEVNRCIASAAMPPPQEQGLADVSVFDVWLSVPSEKINLAEGGGNPVWSNGSDGLGGQRSIHKEDVTDLSAVSADVSDCRDSASRDGVIQRYQSLPPAYDGVYMQSSSVSIAPMLSRFDACLQRLGYQVAETKHSL